MLANRITVQQPYSEGAQRLGSPPSAPGLPSTSRDTVTSRLCRKRRVSVYRQRDLRVLINDASLCFGRPFLNIREDPTEGEVPDAAVVRGRTPHEGLEMTPRPPLFLPGHWALPQLDLFVWDLLSPFLFFCPSSDWATPRGMGCSCPEFSATLIPPGHRLGLRRESTSPSILAPGAREWPQGSAPDHSPGQAWSPGATSGWAWVWHPPLHPCPLGLLPTSKSGSLWRRDGALGLETGSFPRA